MADQDKEPVAEGTPDDSKDEQAAPEPKPDASPDASPDTPPDTSQDTSQSREKAKALLSKAGKSVKGGARRAGEGARAVWADPLMLVKKIDSLLDWVHDALPADLFELVSGWFAQLGYAGLVLSALVGFVYFLVTSIRERSFAMVLYGAGFVVLLIIAQYAAHKFIGAVRTMVKSAPSRLTSRAFLRCVAVISEILGLLILARFTVRAIQDRSMVPLLSGLGLCVLCEALAYVAIHPSLISVSISEDTSAGEEAIGILSFFVKAFVRVIPLVFGTGVLVGTLVLLFSIFSPSAANNEAIAFFGSMPGMKETFAFLSMQLQLPGAVSLVLASALVPFVGYILFAAYCLIIELMRSILSLPRLLEKRG